MPATNNPNDGVTEHENKCGCLDLVREMISTCTIANLRSYYRRKPRAFVCYCVSVIIGFAVFGAIVAACVTDYHIGNSTGPANSNATYLKAFASDYASPISTLELPIMTAAVTSIIVANQTATIQSATEVVPSTVYQTETSKASVVNITTVDITSTVSGYSPLIPREKTFWPWLTEIHSLTPSEAVDLPGVAAVPSNASKISGGFASQAACPPYDLCLADGESQVNKKALYLCLNISGPSVPAETRYTGTIPSCLQHDWCTATLRLGVLNESITYPCVRMNRTGVHYTIAGSKPFPYGAINITIPVNVSATLTSSTVAPTGKNTSSFMTITPTQNSTSMATMTMTPKVPASVSLCYNKIAHMPVDCTGRSLPPGASTMVLSSESHEVLIAKCLNMILGLAVALIATL